MDLTWIGENADIITLIAAVALFCSVFCYVPIAILRSRKVPTSVMGEGMMITRAEWERQHRSKREQQRQDIVDMIEDGLLKLFAEGKLDSVSYVNWHARFAGAFAFEDLLPVKVRDLQELKDMLQKRRNGGTYYGLYKTVDIPGPKPGEQEVHARNELHAILMQLK